MREAENGGDSSESDVEGGEEVGYAFPYYIEQKDTKTQRHKDTRTQGQKDKNTKRQKDKKTNLMLKEVRI